MPLKFHAAGLPLLLSILLFGTGCASGFRTAAPSASELRKLKTIDGKPAALFTDRQSTNLFIFVAVDCPIANKYAPEISRIAREYSTQKIKTWLVYTDPEITEAQAQKHIEEYDLPQDALLDPRHDLAHFCHATVTPEAALFKGNQLIYHGRIDDRYASLGVVRSHHAKRDLIEAIESMLAGKPAPIAHEPAIGCYIEAK